MPGRAVLTGIVFILKSGLPWGMLPKEMAAAPAALAGGGSRSGKRQGVWRRLHQVLLDRLG